MSEQIMWAVKRSDGELTAIRGSEAMAKLTVVSHVYLWPNAEKLGYRCIRVKVTEVEGA